MNSRELASAVHAHTYVIRVIHLLRPGPPPSPPSPCNLLIGTRALPSVPPYLPSIGIPSTLPDRRTTSHALLLTLRGLGWDAVGGFGPLSSSSAGPLDRGRLDDT